MLQLALRRSISLGVFFIFRINDDLKRLYAFYPLLIAFVVFDVLLFDVYLL